MKNRTCCSIAAKAVLLSLLTFCFTGCTLLPAGQTEEEIPFVPGSSASDAGQPDQNEQISVPVSANVFYEGLNENQKVIYQKIKDGIAGFEKSIELPALLSEEEFSRVLNILAHQEPELFQFGSAGQSLGIQYSNQDGAVVRFEPAYVLEQEAYNEQIGRIETVKEQVLGQINEAGITDVYGKACLINDFLADSVTYDLNAPNAHSMYGALAENRAVCEGYCLAMRYLLNAAGVENFIVIGEASSSPEQTETTSHSWMAIRMDDGWYYTDPTWNDTDQKPEQMGRHFYFNLGYDELMAGRNDAWTIENMGAYPQENHSDNSWYVRNGRLAATLEDLQVMMEDYVSAYETDPSLSPIFSVRFTDPAVCEQAKEEFAPMMLQAVQDYSALDWQNGLYLVSNSVCAVDWYVPWISINTDQ